MSPDNQNQQLPKKQWEPPTCRELSVSSVTGDTMVATTPSTEHNGLTANNSTGPTTS